MATDADARSLGFALPDGDDLISGGDDAISQNARAAADIHAALTPRMFYRGPLPMNTNVDDAHTLEWAGMWTVSNATFAESIQGLPDEVPSNRRLGQFLILPIGSSVTSQFYFPYGYNNVTELWFRTTAWAGSPSRPHEFND